MSGQYLIDNPVCAKIKKYMPLLYRLLFKRLFQNSKYWTVVFAFEDACISSFRVDNRLSFCKQKLFSILWNCLILFKLTYWFFLWHIRIILTLNVLPRFYWQFRFNCLIFKLINDLFWSGLIERELLVSVYPGFCFYLCIGIPNI